ncbi:MAG: homogentisate 1,2-dioxygenase [Caulobacteraceae bacterium]|nr:homogentisate 1,2-dioxygenase [Caulobacteraceae bacterium]
MTLKAWTLAAALAALPLAAEAQMAQEAPPAACPAADASLLPALAGWPHKAAVAGATSAAGLSNARLTVGEAARVSLHPTPEVAYPLQPEKPGGSVSHGGLVEFSVAAAGDYQVALSSGAWIDVVAKGQAVVSTAHGHGPACSTIRKMVDFSLQPGRYVLQISANADPDLGLMIVRRP